MYCERSFLWPVKEWLPAVKAKGLEISGTFSRRQGQMYMDMSFTNKALQHMTDFAIQFNKNRSVLVFLFTVIGIIVDDDHCCIFPVTIV